MADNSSELLIQLRARGALTQRLTEILQNDCVLGSGSQDAGDMAGWIQRTDLALERWAGTLQATATERAWVIVHLQLIAMRKSSAINTLIRAEWLRSTKTTPVLNKSRIESLRPQDQSDVIGLAWLFCEISGLFYRIMRPEEGLQALTYARRFRDRAEEVSTNEAESAVDRCLLGAAIAISSTRLERRVQRFPGETSAHYLVNKGIAAGIDELEAAAQSLHAIEETWPISNYQGGIDLYLAMIRDLQAVLHWQQGGIEEGRRLAHEAIALLSCGSTNDEIRLAVAQKTAATIEAAQSRTNSTAAVRWSTAARQIFRRYHHPFEWRALIQEALCHIKAERRPAAELALGQLKDAMRSVPENDEVETSYAYAEAAVAWTWLHQRRVLGAFMSYGVSGAPLNQNPEFRQAWLKAAEPFSAWTDKIPKRVLAEGLLQLGLAKMGSAEKEVVEEGRKHVLAARHAAQSAGRAATETACLLALAESHHYDPESKESSIYWREAKRLLALVESSFLRQWAARLEPLFAESIVVGLNKPWAVVERNILEAYLRYHIEHRSTTRDVLASTGISKTRFYELLRELGLQSSLTVRTRKSRYERPTAEPSE